MPQRDAMQTMARRVTRNAARHAVRVVIVAVLAGTLGAALGACGQRGPLFLPDPNNPDKRR